MKHPTILCCLPTRERPFEAGLTIGSFLATRTEDDTDLIIRLDRDDPLLMAYKTYDTFIVDERIGLAGSLEQCAKESEDDAFMLCADDLQFCSVGWDETFARSLFDHWIVWGDDGKRGADLPTHPVVHRKFVETMGWWCLVGLKHHFIDGVWKVLSDGSGCGRYHPEVLIHHHQGRSGRSVMPASYSFKADEQRFQQWLEQESAADIAKLKLAFETWKGEKAWQDSEEYQRRKEEGEFQ